MPNPSNYKNEKDFMEDCIPIVMKEGKAKDNKQAYAICNSMWNKSMQIYKDEILKEKISYGGYLSPEPGDLDEKGRTILSHTYANCRSNGGDKEKCSKIAWNAVNEAKKSQTLNMIQSIRKSMIEIIQKICKVK